MQKFSTPDPVQGDPVPFQVEYVRWLTHTVDVNSDDQADPRESREERYTERQTETFHRRPDVSGTIVMQVELIGDPGPHGTGNSATLDFIDAALIPEDVDRWHKLIEDPDVHLHIEVVSGIARWLYQEYTANPSRQP